MIALLPRPRTASDDEPRTRRIGRKAPKRKTEATLPGRVFFMAIVGAVPIAVLFIVGPLALGAEKFAVVEWPTWRYLFLLGTPVAAVAALVTFFRAPKWARDHNAARAGRMLAFADAALWLVYGALYVFLFVMRDPPVGS